MTVNMRREGPSGIHAKYVVSIDFQPVGTVRLTQDRGPRWVASVGGVDLPDRIEGPLAGRDLIVARVARTREVAS